MREGDFLCCCFCDGVGFLVPPGSVADVLFMYYEEMEQSGTHLTKEVFVALIHAYAACCEDYEEQMVILLLKELSGQDWFDGFRWAIRYSIQNKNLSSTIELLKQLKVYYNNVASKRISGTSFTRRRRNVSYEAYDIISKFGSTYLQFGLDLLDLIKKERLSPSMMCLDILLHLCAESRDLNNANFVWREYVFAKIPHGPLSYLRWASNLCTIFSLSYSIFLLLMVLLYGCSMYHVLLASGDHKSADIILNNVPSFLSGVASHLKKRYSAKMDEEEAVEKQNGKKKKMKKKKKKKQPKDSKKKGKKEKPRRLE
ncbi:hypothetical protein MtrunA17_Chr5g0413891 [Medicago truncatula]|uniref:Transmembrane protein n=1 Tax=Medicago truncatula TaxID=3880 RepID=A0A396HWM3_MEDTR|nr:hypothetical protein MtrunA17_Chr5g0413891 [Medicago truncatula]